ncbi:PREDICTED: uncharacterized protein LOC105559977 [Vollenhovia emeryi]|uniref:uncharacterized protein LOC105559977 n=1 Tax=Vollenhovia emeryi TaxID=411798 RepID=UPI0005F516A6|nr:PREDICTED: uncharacterized protein LOC105559977 [Vollenhovia emeryi]
MNNADDVITSIYDTLLHLRYPHITNVESRDLEATILTGENRVSLLSWLLTEKSPPSSIVANLGKLKNDALEDQLFEYYSQIGICKNKDMLLGKCSLKEQLPTLRLLLDFMRKVYVEPVASTNETEEIDIIKLCIDDAHQAPFLPVVEPKMSYAEAIKYLEETEKKMLDNDCGEIRTNLPEDLHTETDDRLVSEEQDALFDKTNEKFIEAFRSISSWPVRARSLDKNISDSICTNMKSICSNFASLKKVLRAKEEISNVKLAKGLPETAAPLNAIIEDIIVCNEQLENLNGD